MKVKSFFIIIILFSTSLVYADWPEYGPAWNIQDGVVGAGASATDLDLSGFSSISGLPAESDPIAMPILTNHTGSDPHLGIFPTISTTGSVQVGTTLDVNEELTVDNAFNVTTSLATFDVPVTINSLDDNYLTLDSDTDNSGQAASGLQLHDDGIRRWDIIKDINGGIKFNRYDASGVFQDQPLSISGTTGIIIIKDMMSRTAGRTQIFDGAVELISLDNNKVGIGITNPNSLLSVNGSMSTVFANVSSSAVAVDDTFHRIDCLTNDNDVTLNLPTAVGIEGRCHPIRIVNASGNICYLEGAGTETLSPDGINAFLNYSGLNTSGENVDICSDGTNWQVWE